MWDSRTYKLVKTFHGHTSWVKNVEPLQNVNFHNYTPDNSNNGNFGINDNPDISQDHSESDQNNPGNLASELLRSENRKNLFLTAAFDGTIRLWDLKRDYPSIQNADNIIFNDPTLIRIKLSPASNTLAISLTDGLLFLIHDLDMGNLFTDMSLPIRQQRALYYLAMNDFYKHGREKIQLPSCMTRAKNRIEVVAKVREISRGFR